MVSVKPSPFFFVGFDSTDPKKVTRGGKVSAIGSKRVSVNANAGAGRFFLAATN